MGCADSVRRVWSLIRTIFGTARSSLRTHRELALENLALRHQIGVLTRALGDRRPRFLVSVAGTAGCGSSWLAGGRHGGHALAIVQPATVVRWHREGCKRFWTRRSRVGGRPALSRELVGLIRKMSTANVTWGAPRIRNELAKLGIEVAVSTVARYMVKQRNPSSPSWRAFLDNHVKDLVAIDFFAVPTATFGVLFGFLVLAHDRRRVLHFNVTANPAGPTATCSSTRVPRASEVHCRHFPRCRRTLERRLPHGWTPRR